MPSFSRWRCSLNFRSRTFLLFTFFLAFVQFLQIAAVSGQTVSTGAIAGTVTDPSGSLIAGVQVAATDKGTGAKRSASTDASANYRFSLLPPGQYQLEFTATGFKKAVPPDVSVAITEISTLNVQMVLGEARETVEVTSTAQLVQSENAALGTVVESGTITELPL